MLETLFLSWLGKRAFDQGAKRIKNLTYLSGETIWDNFEKSIIEWTQEVKANFPDFEYNEFFELLVGENSYGEKNFESNLRTDITNYNIPTKEAWIDCISIIWNNVHLKAIKTEGQFQTFFKVEKTLVLPYFESLAIRLVNVLQLNQHFFQMAVFEFMQEFRNSEKQISRNIFSQIKDGHIFHPDNQGKLELPRKFIGDHFVKFVGRKREINQLQRLTQPGHIAILSGIKGSGKKRLFGQALAIEGRKKEIMKRFLNGKFSIIEIPLKKDKDASGVLRSFVDILQIQLDENVYFDRGSEDNSFLDGPDATMVARTENDNELEESYGIHLVLQDIEDTLEQINRGSSNGIVILIHGFLPKSNLENEFRILKALIDKESISDYCFILTSDSPNLQTIDLASQKYLGDLKHLITSNKSILLPPLDIESAQKLFLDAINENIPNDLSQLLQSTVETNPDICHNLLAPGIILKTAKSYNASFGELNFLDIWLSNSLNLNLPPSDKAKYFDPNCLFTPTSNAGISSIEILLCINIFEKLPTPFVTQCFREEKGVLKKLIEQKWLVEQEGFYLLTNLGKDSILVSLNSYRGSFRPNNSFESFIFETLDSILNSIHNEAQLIDLQSIMQENLYFHDHLLEKPVISNTIFRILSWLDKNWTYFEKKSFESIHLNHINDRLETIYDVLFIISKKELYSLNENVAKKAWLFLENWLKISHEINSVILRTIDQYLVYLRRIDNEWEKRIRVSVIEKLQHSIEQNLENHPILIKWGLSWLINLIDSPITNKQADQPIELANWILRKILSVTDSHDAAWLMSRTKTAISKYQIDKDKIQSLIEAEQSALMALYNSNKAFRWQRFYIRAVRRLTWELNEDSSFQYYIKKVFDIFESIVGKQEKWPYRTVIIVASFQREVASSIHAPLIQIQYAKQSINILQKHIRRMKKDSELQDNRGVLALVRSHEVLFRIYDELFESSLAKTTINRAIAILRPISKSNADADTWIVFLRLLDQKNNLLQSGHEITVIAMDLDREIRNCESWIKTASSYTESNFFRSKLANLKLWCISRRILALPTFGTALDQPKYSNAWRSAKSDNERKRIISAIYETRLKDLKGIEKEYGWFPKLSVEYLRLSISFEGCLMLKRIPIAESEPDKILLRALQLDTNNVELLVAYAQYASYTWSLELVFELCKTILRLSKDSKRRREITYLLSESRLRYSIYYLDPNREKNQIRENLWNAKRDLLYLTSFKRSSLAATSLLYRIELELDSDNVNWEKIDEAFETSIGGPNSHFNLILMQFALLQERPFDDNTNDGQSTIRTIFIENPGNTMLLSNLGCLYLRKAELTRNLDSIIALQKAICIFEAISSWEYSFTKLIRPKTLLQFCRCLIRAMEYQKSLVPFPTSMIKFFRAKKGISWEEMLNSKLSSASDRSIGEFHRAVKSEISRFRNLKKILKE